MKKVFLKFITSILVLILAVTMCIPTHALAANTTGTIIVNGLEPNVTVTAYKIIEVNLDKNGIPKQPIYQWVDEVATWLSNNNNKYKNYIDTANNNAVTDDFLELTSITNSYPTKQDAAPIREFQHDLELAIKSNSIIFQDNETALENQKVFTETSSINSVNFTVPMGQYLLIASYKEDSTQKMIKVYTSTTASLIPEHKDNQWIIKDETDTDPDSNVRISMKSTEPTLTKQIMDPKTKALTTDNTVKIGDTIRYVLKVLVPYYPTNATQKKLVVRDQLPEGLQLIDDIKVFSDAAYSMEIKNTDTITYYTKSLSNIGNDSFKLEFTDTFLNNKEYRGETIYITYPASVTNDACNNMTLVNTAHMDYNPDPYEDLNKTKEDNETVYTYGIKVNKVNKDGQPLAGAKFALLSKENGNNINLSFIKTNDNLDGKYRLAHESEEGRIQTVSTNNNGELEILGISQGEYTLVETNAPDGYPVPNQNITINISADADTGSITGSTVTIPQSLSYNYYDTNTDGTKDANFMVSDHIVHVAVKNDKDNFNLPRTGGAGTFMFTIAGIALMAGAVLIFYYNRRKNNE